MVTYILIMKYLEGRKLRHSVYWTTQREDVTKITNSYKEGNPFWFAGKMLKTPQIKRFDIFVSKLPFKKIVLPNEKNLIDLLDQDKEYVFKNLCQGNVNGVALATIDFTSRSTIPQESISEVSFGQKKTIFIVHGRDEASALSLQKHLTDRGMNAEMFEDFKKRIKGNTTVIEELMKIKDEISYAFIVATPDDLGNYCEAIEKHINELVKSKTRFNAKDIYKIKDFLNYRARQNVLFEYGLFLGVLGREKVECLWNNNIGEEPSDIRGVLNTQFENTIRETFPEIDAKLDNLK